MKAEFLETYKKGLNSLLTFNNITHFRYPNRSTAAQQTQIWTSLDTFATPLPDILKT